MNDLTKALKKKEKKDYWHNQHVSRIRLYTLLHIKANDFLHHSQSILSQFVSSPYGVDRGLKLNHLSIHFFQLQLLFSSISFNFRH